MPLFFQQDINPETKLALWKITEDADFFLERVPAPEGHRSAARQLQHLAGRYLLPILLPAFPLDEIHTTAAGRPCLENAGIDFSISHSGDMAAAMLSRKGRTGIDIEWATPRIRRIMPRFLHPEELSWVQQQEPPPFGGMATALAPWWLPTLLWSAKEAVYKALAVDGVSFQQHIRFEPFALGPSGQISFRFCKQEPLFLQVSYRCWDALCLTWVVS